MSTFSSTVARFPPSPRWPHASLSHADRQWRFEGLCHDGLANRLCGGAPAARQRLAQGHVADDGLPPSISQAAAIAALHGPQDFLSTWINIYRRRRDRSAAVLNKTNAIRCAVPGGAFYLYPWCGGLKGNLTPSGMTIGSAADFVRHPLEDWSVAVVPGAAFEGDPHFRISFATADAHLDEGIRRIGAAVDALSYRG